MGSTMLPLGKRNVLGILVNAIDQEGAVDFISRAARERRSAKVSALAVHGVMTGVLDPEHKFRLNHFDLLVPDGQPVRWALNLLHGAKLSKRVYGPDLMLKVCARAAADGFSIYLYGGTEEILIKLQQSLRSRFPGLSVAGAEPSKFRRLTPDEKAAVVDRIRRSEASALFVGLGCPRQEVFAYELADSIPMPIIAVGAAFPFLAGIIPQAPAWMQNMGLEWLFRLAAEPRRLWRRYVYLNPAYATLAILQAIGISHSPDGRSPVREELYG
jgi:N-acetylglucosaminyldiphosphoundecaprenol N-acetyl-beta-D-mannosaminyltransferase